METKKIKVIKYVDGVTTDEWTELFDCINNSRSYVKELIDDCQVSHNKSIYGLIYERLTNCLLNLEDLQLFQIKDYVEE